MLKFLAWQKKLPAETTDQQGFAHAVLFLYCVWIELPAKSTNHRQNDTHILKMFSLAKKLPAESTDQQCFAHVV